MIYYILLVGTCGNAIMSAKICFYCNSQMVKNIGMCVFEVRVSKAVRGQPVCQGREVK